jgi:hypothetical protein
MLAAAEKKTRTRGGEDSNLIKEIQESVGSYWIFNYYVFRKHYGYEPKDFEDWFDGLRSLPIILKLEGPRL